MSSTFRFQSALVEDQWQSNVEISVGDNGLIEKIESEVSGDVSPLVALPGMVNLHSHAFQRGFVGQSEYRTSAHDSFWTWRKQMYEFVNQVNPESIYSIAKQLYAEMVSAGYTWVGEFHYLHNDIGGSRYSNISEMSDAIQQAAQDTGIGLCHLPVLYQRAGFAEEDLVPGQDRFVLSVEEVLELFERCRSNIEGNANASLGLAIHSLRAVAISSASRAIEHVRNFKRDLPIHIHVAEQVKEVKDCLQFSGCRPVQFLFDNLPVDSNWCLVHATHLDDMEMSLIAESEAVVGLCPTTEANLGDGFFQARQFLDQNGKIGIGSDSHCSIDFREELRLLEYGQRLQHRGRAILGSENRSVGRNLYCLAAEGGARALGINAGRIGVGKRADFTLIDPKHPAIGDSNGDQLLDRLVFVNVGNPVVGVIVGGRRVDSSLDHSS